MIDRKEFNEYWKNFDHELLVEIIDMFIAEYDDRFTALNKNVADGDIDQLQFNSHSLKGVIAHFKDPLTIEKSIRLNLMAKNKVEKGLKEALEDLQVHTLKLIEELKVIRNKPRR